ncbi:WSC domain-containing protein [Pyronema omphalodes]|nr:WSC domain-containing protein [Pyronema omphalodes]
MQPLSALFLLSTLTVGLVSARSNDTEPIPVPSIGPWLYKGCANEVPPLGRTLNGPSVSGNITAESCAMFCTNQDYPLAGLEYGVECYCGYSLQNGATYNQDGCNMPCFAKPSEVCGGVDRLTVYENKDFVFPKIVQEYDGYKTLGCHTEGITERTLAEYSFVDPEMTVPLCVDTCNSKGYKYAGVEYSTECYCANTISNQTTKVPDDQCNFKCAGDKKTFCGGSDRLVVYADSAKVNEYTEPRLAKRFYRY